MPPIQSLVVMFARYHAKARALDLTFPSQDTYRYFRVPPETYAGLLAADSKGEYFK